MIVFLAMFAGFASAERQDTGPATSRVDELVQITQRLMDSLAGGEKELWKQYLADDCIFTDEKGSTFNKTEYLQQLEPLPPGYSGTIKVENPRFRDAGSTQILVYDMAEQEIIFGQVLKVRYRETDTWVNRGGKWQILASQVLRLYQDPARGTVKPETLPDYAGEYELTPGVRLTVTAENGQLFKQRSGRPRVELIPETPDVFFVSGAEDRTIFDRAGDGHVARIISRRDGEDVIWTKVNGK
jgi:hypothetical protein